jgi:hypothetical protein
MYLAVIFSHTNVFQVDILMRFITSLLSLLLMHVSFHCPAQTSGSVFNFSDLYIVAEIDSSQNIGKLTTSAYDRLIENMYLLDQKYRKEVMKTWHLKIKDSAYTTPEDAENWKRIKVNDKANQALLLRLLKKYNWPGGKGENGSAQKAWYIAWHASANEKHVFYPYLQEAVKRGLFDQKVLDNYREKMRN